MGEVRENVEGEVQRLLEREPDLCIQQLNIRLAHRTTKEIVDAIENTVGDAPDDHFQPIIESKSEEGET